MTRTEIIDYLLAIRTRFQMDTSTEEDRAIAEAIEIVEKGACDTENPFNNLDLSTKICELKNRIVSSDGQDYVQLYDVLETIKRHKEPRETWGIKDVADCFEKHKLIEQEPCEDSISRQAVLDIVDSYSESQSNVEDVTQDMISDILALTLVNPKEKTGH